MSDFGKAMALWAEKTNQGVDEAIRRAVVDVSSRIIKRTPVDTGRARGNWIPSIGAPVLNSVSEKGLPESTVISNVIKQSNSATGNVFYLTNNLPYIGRLEYQGWSKQAPRGMVRVTVLEFNAAMTKALNEVKSNQ